MYGHLVLVPNCTQRLRSIGSPRQCVTLVLGAVLLYSVVEYNTYSRYMRISVTHNSLGYHNLSDLHDDLSHSVEDTFKPIHVPALYMYISEDDISVEGKWQ